MPRTKEQFRSIKNETRARIQEAGLRLFVNKGLLGASVSEIATLAGISKGLMYHYYPSKEDLYSDLVGTAIQSSNEFMQRYRTIELTPAEKIKQISLQMVAVIQQTEETAQFFVFVNRSMLEENVPEKALEYIQQAYVIIEIMEEIIREGQKHGEVKSG